MLAGRMTLLFIVALFIFGNSFFSLHIAVVSLSLVLLGVSVSISRVREQGRVMLTGQPHEFGDVKDCIRLFLYDNILI